MSNCSLFPTLHSFACFFVLDGDFIFSDGVSFFASTCGHAAEESWRCLVNRLGIQDADLVNIRRMRLIANYIEWSVCLRHQLVVGQFIYSI